MCYAASGNSLYSSVHIKSNHVCQSLKVILHIPCPSSVARLEFGTDIDPYVGGNAIDPPAEIHWLQAREAHLALKQPSELPMWWLILEAVPCLASSGLTYATSIHDHGLRIESFLYASFNAKSKVVRVAHDLLIKPLAPSLRSWRRWH
jgi:hypothetical protein